MPTDTPAGAAGTTQNAGAGDPSKAGAAGAAGDPGKAAGAASAAAGAGTLQDPKAGGAGPGTGKPGSASETLLAGAAGDPQKDAAGKPAAPAAAPEKYDAFKLPEGFSADDALLGQALPVFKELGLSQAGAQRLVDLYAAQQNALEAQHRAMVDEWTGKLPVDSVIGGHDHAVKVKAARGVIERFGDAELKEVLGWSGLHAHPALVRFVYRISTQFAEGVVGGASGGGLHETPEQAAARLYPSMSKKE